MSKPGEPPKKTGPSTFKQVDVGQKVVLNDAYLTEHHQTRQLEAIAKRTMENAETQAKRVISEAQAEAQRILEEAQRQADIVVQQEGTARRDAIIEEARAVGYEAGLDEGFAKISADLAETIAHANRVVEKALDAESHILNRARQSHVEVIKSVLKRVLPYELSSRPEQIAGLLEKAVAQLHASGTAKIIINPVTLKLVKAAASQTVESLAALHHIAFVPDMGCGIHEMYLEGVEASYELSPDVQAAIYLAPLAQLETTPAWLTSDTPPENLQTAAEMAPEAESVDQPALDSETALPLDAHLLKAAAEPEPGVPAE